MVGLTDDERCLTHTLRVEKHWVCIYMFIHHSGRIQAKTDKRDRQTELFTEKNTLLSTFTHIPKFPKNTK